MAAKHLTATSSTDVYDRFVRVMLTRPPEQVESIGLFKLAVYVVCAFSFRIRTPQRLQRWSAHAGTHDKKDIPKGVYSWYSSYYLPREPDYNNAL